MDIRMKKILILLLTLIVFGLCIEIDKYTKYVDGLFIYAAKNGQWSLISMSVQSCGNTLAKQIIKYNYAYKGDSISVFRCKEHTLLFKGKLNSPDYVESDENGLVSDPYVDLEGFCYDKSGINKKKYVNKLTACEL